MPTLRIMSIYQERERQFASELDQARTELAQFRASLVVSFGKETAAAIRQHVRSTEDMLFGRVEVLPLPKKAEPAVKTLRTLMEKVTAVLKKIRTPDCWFRETMPAPISVLETAGLSWDEVRGWCFADGFLPISRVLSLLDTLRTTEQVMPSDEQVSEWAGAGRNPCHLTEEWQRILKRRKRRLVGLLEKAAELEEELRYSGG